MRSTTPTPTLTYFSTEISRNGNAQRVSVSLPFISSIADDPHYREPEPEPEPARLAIDRPPRWSEKLIRRTMGRDRKQTARLLNQVQYEATVRRIDRGGV